MATRTEQRFSVRNAKPSGSPTPLALSFETSLKRPGPYSYRGPLQRLGTDSSRRPKSDPSRSAEPEKSPHQSPQSRTFNQ